MSLYRVQETKPVVRNPPFSTDYAQFAGSGIPIVIDNGSSEICAGWGSEDAPRLACENVTARFRDRKALQHVLLAGGEVYVDATARANLKAPHDTDIVCNFDAMEHMLDYVFAHLGINDDHVAHPVAMTETFANPLYSRNLMSELIFEVYNAPSLTYSIDSLASFYGSGNSDGLVVSSATGHTHIIPVINGRGILANSKRYSWGSNTATEYLLKLCQLKYPSFPTRMTQHQASCLIRDHCETSLDYQHDISRLSDSTQLASYGRVIQFPFQLPAEDERTEEEKARALEKRQEQTKKMREQLARQRLEKLVQKEQELATFQEIKAMKDQERKVDYLKRINAEGFKTEAELDAAIAKAEKILTRARRRQMGLEDDEEKEKPTFSLVDIPDHQLNEEDLKEKKKQKLLKAGYDARERARQEKEAEKQRQEEERINDEEARKANPQLWVENLRTQHEDVMLRMKERKKRKEQLHDRKSLAAQQRMKSIATLASDAPSSGRKKRKKDGEDTFGANDEDWQIYREIGGVEDSEEEEEDQLQLADVESRLLEFDPTFSHDDTATSKSRRKHHLINAFVRGMAPSDPLSSFDPANAEQASQLHLNIERIRVPEVIFQPQLAGLDCAGLVECIGHILKQFTLEDQTKLSKSIYVTGGNTLVPNFDARLQADVREMMPTNQEVNIVRPANVRLGAWNGLAKWSRTEDFKDAQVTRQDYMEMGGEYIREHRLSNSYRRLI